jgi:nodulation protein E
MIRVVITGIGIVSPFGRGAAATLEALRSRRSGVRRIDAFDTSELTCRIGGEVPPGTPLGEASEFKGYDRFSRFALLAAGDAVEQSRFAEAGYEPERVGAIIGTGLGGSETLDAGYKRIYGERQQRISPLAIAASMYNAAASAVATRHNARGITYAPVSACASSAHAIGQAFQAIQFGQADAILAGGADAPLTFGIIRAWESMRVLAVDNDDPSAACRPFSADRKGLVLAEGAAVFVLEPLDAARRRGAPLLGEVTGFGITSDAGHITDPSPDGAARAMSLAVRESGLAPEEIEYINAHGTATRANDPTETAAIKLVFGERARAIPVSSTKSLHGHAMGASGSIEIASSLLALNDGFIPPTINLVTPDPACDLDYVPNEARAAQVRHFLSNSFGFGGMNGVVAIRTLHGL